MHNLSIRLGNGLAKAGITTRKSSVRLAEETGKLLADKVLSGQGKIDKSTITSAIEESLPKRLRPEILTKPDELVKALVNTGYSEKQAIYSARNLQHNNLCVISGDKKSPIFMHLEQSNEILIPLFTHELEHSLEVNSRCKMRKNKLIRNFYNLIYKLFDKQGKMRKANVEDVQKLNIDSVNIQNLIYITSGIGKVVDLKNQTIDIPPIKDSLYRILGLTRDSVYTKMSELMNNFADCTVKNENNSSVFKFFINIFKKEIAAYTAGGEVHKYMLNNPDKTPAQTATVFLYEDMLNVMEQSYRTYRRNKRHNRLREQDNVYHSDSDIYKLAQNDKQKAFLDSILPKMNEIQKSSIYRLIKLKPDYLELYENNIKNPLVGDIAKIKSDDGQPVYYQSFDYICQASPEKIEEFSQIADKKNADGKFIYQNAAFCINHPRFDLIKKIAETELNGKNPYWEISGSIFVLTEKELEKVYEKILFAQANGEDITNEINAEIMEKASMYSQDELAKILLGAE